MSIALDLDTRSIDFTQEYTQVDLKTYVYMDISQGFEIEGLAHSEAYFFKLLTNWYGLKDAGLTWFDYLKTGLIDRGFI